MIHSFSKRYILKTNESFICILNSTPYRNKLLFYLRLDLRTCINLLHNVPARPTWRSNKASACPRELYTNILLLWYIHSNLTYVYAQLTHMLAYFPYLEQVEVGLWSHTAVCVRVLPLTSFESPHRYAYATRYVYRGIRCHLNGALHNSVPSVVSIPQRLSSLK
jgi:hypothetical protein